MFNGETEKHRCPRGKQDSGLFPSPEHLIDLLHDPFGSLHARVDQLFRPGVALRASRQIVYRLHGVAGQDPGHDADYPCAPFIQVGQVNPRLFVCPLERCSSEQVVDRIGDRKEKECCPGAEADSVLSFLPIGARVQRSDFGHYLRTSELA